MKHKITLFFSLSLFVCLAKAQTWKTYPYLPSTTPESEISFPVDEGRHNGEGVEWWYVSGHVKTASNKSYSFMLAYFYYPVNIGLSFDGFRILNVSDESDGTFYSETKAITKYTTLSTTGLDLAASLFLSGSEFWRNKLDGSNNPLPFQYELNASNTDVEINFELETLKRPLIVGEDGKFDQGAASYTYYYSQTDNSVSGSIKVNGVTEIVTGSAWIDRQYGNFNPFTEEDYEWFSLKLDNGMDFNLWNLFTADREIPDNSKYKILSAYIDENQNTQYTTTDFEIERLEFFTTPDKERTYSKKWRLTSESKKIDLVITSNFENSEVNITELNFRFFEGATTMVGTVDGVSVNGVGFAELLHSYENPALSITEPSGGVFDPQNPISWEVDNPDDGRDLLFDVEYSTDNKVTFKTIATGVEDTSFDWDANGLNNGDNIWFKIKAYSKDNFLQGETISESSSSAVLNTSLRDKTAVQIFPNPVKDKLIIKTENIATEASIEIIDLLGKTVYRQNLNESLSYEVNLKFLQKGLYLLRFNGDGIKQVSKFVKE